MDKKRSLKIFYQNKMLCSAEHLVLREFYILFGFCGFPGFSGFYGFRKFRKGFRILRIFRNPEYVEFIGPSIL